MTGRLLQKYAGSMPPRMSGKVLEKQSVREGPRLIKHAVVSFTPDHYRFWGKMQQKKIRMRPASASLAPNPIPPPFLVMLQSLIPQKFYRDSMGFSIESTSANLEAIRSDFLAYSPPDCSAVVVHKCCSKNCLTRTSYREPSSPWAKPWSAPGTIQNFVLS